MKKAMTAAEFIAFWLEPDHNGRTELDYAEENIGEREAQFASECGLYGDAGVGQGLALREIRADHAKVLRRLRQLGAIK